MDVDTINLSEDSCLIGWLNALRAFCLRIEKEQDHEQKIYQLHRAPYDSINVKNKPDEGSINVIIIESSNRQELIAFADM